jgi:acetoin utilization deacetylase AcuC-like enzyme
MPAGSTDEDYERVFKEQLLPEAERFAPDFVMISAGFDAHREDPLSAIGLSDEAYGNMTRAVMEIAAKCCGGRLVSVLEGGYYLPALTRCVEKHISVLMEGKG